MANFLEFKQYFTRYLKKELKSDLYYHGLHHTLEVYDNAVEIAAAEKISSYELVLLKTATLLHDSGFVFGYTNHEEVGCKLAKDILPKYNYTTLEIEQVCGMIMATKIPQTPHNLLEKIIADADLMYLGTDNYDEISTTLFQELQVYAGLKNEADWLKLQVAFLETHHFHTPYCIKNFTSTEQENLQKLKQLER